MMDGSTPAPRWYVATTDHRAEFAAARRLAAYAAARGIPLDVLLPLERVFLFRRSERIQIDRPFFPGYLLLAFSLAEPWRWIADIAGVRSILADEHDMPLPVPASAVAEIRRLHEDYQALTPEAATKRVASRFAEGDNVVPLRGVWRDHGGTVLSVDRRIRVLLSLFGRGTVVEIDPCDLERA